MDALQVQSAYNHSATRLTHREGLLVDTGAVDDLTGLDFVKRQAEVAQRHGRQVKWEELAKPKRVSGAGGRTDF